MKTTNLTKTNFFNINVQEIEKFLGKEIESVYNYKCGYTHNILDVAPGHKRGYIYHFNKVNKWSFDQNTGVLTITGHNKWERKMSTVMYQYEKVGYKLPTTHIEQGFIWGNPQII